VSSKIFSFPCRLPIRVKHQRILKSCHFPIPTFPLYNNSGVFKNLKKIKISIIINVSNADYISSSKNIPVLTFQFQIWAL